jgi:Ni,Fe-hydrogenase I small subunit
MSTLRFRSRVSWCHKQGSKCRGMTQLNYTLKNKLKNVMPILKFSLKKSKNMIINLELMIRLGHDI